VKAGEFIRRFLLHILPGGFMKIRYDGFLAHANKKALSVKRPSATRAWAWGCHLA